MTSHAFLSVVCAAGLTRDLVDRNKCVPCAGDFSYKPIEGYNRCKACPAGKKANKTKTLCIGKCLGTLEGSPHRVNNCYCDVHAWRRQRRRRRRRRRWRNSEAALNARCAAGKLFII